MSQSEMLAPSEPSSSWVLGHYARHASTGTDPREALRRALAQIMLGFAGAQGLSPLEARGLVTSLAPEGAAPIEDSLSMMARSTPSGRSFATLRCWAMCTKCCSHRWRKAVESDAAVTSTSGTVARRLVDRVFAIATEPRDAFVVLDPAMGAGRFLLEALRFVSPSCLHGVDIDPLAVWVARASIALTATVRPDLLCAQLRVGDALRDALPVADVVIGNPPWVAHAGRQSVALEPAIREGFRLRFHAFAGFPTTHGMFIEQSARALGRDGVLGLLVPTQMSDLAGYSATREALTARASVVEPLEELGFGQFAGVTEPTLMLIARRNPSATASPRPWHIEERDGGPGASVPRRVHRELERLAELPRFDSHLFGEAGFQTAGKLAKTHLGDWPTNDPRFSVPLREGRDVEAFYVSPPSRALDPEPAALEQVRARLRSPEAYARVNVVIRQTARYPIAAVHEPPGAFRNSLLAGYAEDPFALVALLNSTLLRSVHLATQRDGRQAVFPQLKIAHLRALPAPPVGSDVAELSRLGKLAGEAQSARHAVTARFRDEMGVQVPRTLFRPEGAAIPVRQAVLATLVRARDGCDHHAITGAYERALEAARRAWSDYNDVLAEIDRQTFRLYGVDPDAWSR